MSPMLAALAVGTVDGTDVLVAGDALVRAVLLRRVLALVRS
jgi:hypothetical protein